MITLRREQIEGEVLRLMTDRHPDGFDRVALDVFVYQYAANHPYRAYCERRGARPETITHWSEIPALPTAAFTEADLLSAPAEKVFLTSGTTRGGEKRGRHGFPTLALYETSLKENFRAHLLPDGSRLPMILLAHSPEELPTSSLSHMLGVVRRAWGAEGSRYYVRGGRVDCESVIAALSRAEAEGTPVFLLGVTVAYVQVVEYCRERKIRFHLPTGSRLMDTGGFKGKRPERSRGALLRDYTDLFGIPPEWCVNEYGMTEMGSQFYDNTALAAWQGISLPRGKVIPPWVRTRIVDPETGEDLPEGKVGCLLHYDLANCGSVIALETEDLGCRVGEGFEIVGRVPGTEARGCSGTIDGSGEN